MNTMTFKITIPESPSFQLKCLAFHPKTGSEKSVIYLDYINEKGAVVSKLFRGLNQKEIIKSAQEHINLKCQK